MKSIEKFTFIIIFLFTSLSAWSMSGRIAVVADGNFLDADDICGTPVSLAMVAIFNQQSKLVHYTHSCDTRNSYSQRESKMNTSLFTTASKWGGFNTSGFFNGHDGTERQSAITHLKNQINNSSSSDLLWIIEAGEPDIIYYAMNAATQSKRAYVRIVTHHPNNDVGNSYDLSDIEALAGTPTNMVVRIDNQNVNLKKPLEDFYWMRDHPEEDVNWLWDRGLLASQDANYPAINGFFDCSDAGMVWYVLTGATSGGDAFCTVAELKAKINGYFDNGSGDTTPPTVSFDTPNNNQSFTAPASIVVTVNASDASGISNVKLYINNDFIRQENLATYDWGLSSQNDNKLANLSEGTYTLKAVAADNAGNTTEKSITVTVGSGGSNGDNVVHMQKANSTGFAIDGGTGASPNQSVKLWTDDNSNVNQQWNEIDRGSGYYSYQKVNSDYCIDGGNGGANGQLLTLQLCSSNDQNQHWLKISAGSGKYRLQKRNAPGYSIDGGNGGAKNVQLKLWTSRSYNQNQQWVFSTIPSLKSEILFNEDAMNPETNSDNLVVYPNPSINGVFQVSEICNWSVYSTSGTKLLEGDDAIVDLSSYPKGIYLFKTKNTFLKLMVK